MKKEHKYYTYILKCCDESYYIGVTNDLERRINEHQIGYNIESYTFDRRPLNLVYCEVFKYIDKAIAREKQLKGWSRLKKEALIKNKKDNLTVLSKRKTKSEVFKKLLKD